MFTDGCRTCCFVTGASRSFGRAVAVEITRALRDGGAKNSTVILIARSKEELRETRQIITTLSPQISANTVVADLSNLTTLEESAKEMFGIVNPADYSHTLFIHNAGTLGDCSRFVRDFNNDIPLVKHYWDLNLTSPFILTAKFLQEFKATKRHIVNVTSLAAVQAVKSLSLYGTGKAARDMMFKCVAAEESEVRVLNYAPGPLSTPMHAEIKEQSADAEIREMFRNTEESGAILSPQQSAEKLIGILKRDQYESGAHIDYYDV